MQNLSCMLEFHRRIRPDAEAIVYDGQRISYSNLYDRVLKLADWLDKQGIGPDSIVALMMKNSPAFFEIKFALSHLGAVSLPLNFRLASDEIQYITEHAGACLLFADEELIETTSDLTIPVIVMDEAKQGDTRHLSRESVGADDRKISVHPRAPNDLFRLMYTSGTTDRPKGVTHSYENLYWKTIDHTIALQLSAKDRLAVVGPLYHVGGFDLPGIGVLWLGGTIVLMRDFDPEQVLNTIAREKITGIWLAPVMTNAILALDTVKQFDVASLKWCIGGGERTPESRIRTFIEVFPNARYIDGYGMTESVSGDTLMEAGYEISKIGSTGRATMHVELEIRDDEGNPLPPMEHGELCMRGETITRGYWKDPERTAAAFWPGGWLRSGDVGYLDEDGFLFLTDRKKDMIISGGENIASSEIERVLYEMPEVLEAAVIGKPDDQWGETPVAVVVVTPGSSLDIERLQSHCRQHLARFKIPKELILSDALPRNPSGKVLKRELRATLVE